MRDLLLGVTPTDFDWLVPDPEASARRQAATVGGSAFALDDERGHWRVVTRAHGDGADATHDFVPVSGGAEGVLADLRRRDLTVNALAARSDGTLIDPTGGLVDLAAGVVRMTSSDAMRADPIRPLRAARFAGALGFTLDPATVAVAREVAAGQRSGTLPLPAAERVGAELRAMVCSDEPAASLRSADQLGLLAVFLPELTATRGVAQGGLHHLDVFDHSLLALTGLVATFPAAGLALRLATLLHDVGKPATAAHGAGRRVTFHGHARLGSVMARRALRRLRFPSSTVATAGELVRLHMLPLPRDEREARRFVHRYRHTLPDLLWLMLADREAARGRLASAAGRTAYREAVGRVVAVLEERPPAPPVMTGHDVMRVLGLEPGPRVGEALALVQEAVAVGDVTDLEDAELLVRRYAAAQGWTAG